MRKLTIIAVAFSALFLASPAHAEEDANFFLQKIREGDQMMLYVLDAYSHGFGWANAIIVKERKALPLYCQPKRLRLTAQMNADILRRFVEEHPDTGTKPAGYALLLALGSAFPCK